MKMENKMELKAAGINLETGLDRFVGDERLFLDFLKKFPEDSSFIKLSQELSKDNVQEAYKAAHTLKGVAGNLSVDSLYQTILPLVEALRKGRLREAKQYFPIVKESYEQIVDVLKKI
ncbi:MAG: hypothetical protein PWP24_1427 [Clostridiales bacterium]|nr:hypothetical protein [Clostridiales bacterium]